MLDMDLNVCKILTVAMDINVFSYFISKRIDVGQKDFENFTLLYTAAKNNHYSDVEMILKEPKIKNLRNNSYHSFNSAPQLFQLRDIVVSKINTIDRLHLVQYKILCI